MCNMMIIVNNTVLHTGNGLRKKSSAALIIRNNGNLADRYVN